MSSAIHTVPIATVSIKWNETHQVIDGFGGAQPAAAAALLANWPEPERSQILDLAFSEVNGIGLTILRTEVLPELETHPGLWNYSDDAQVYIMKQAVARGPVKIMGSVFSPPGWMKDNGSTISGFIDIDHFPQYADYLSHYASQYAIANGVNIYAVSIQNEPDTDGVPWRTCRWDSHQIADFLANHLGPRFASNNIDTKVIAPEAANWDHVEYAVPDGGRPFMYSTYGNPAALARVDIVAGHQYGGNLSKPFQQALDAGKRIWQTEASPGGVEPEGQTTRDIDGALKWAKHMHDGLAGAQASAWLWFILATNPEGTLIELSGDGHSFAPNKTFWALGNFSKFVRPGFVRIGAVIASSTDPSSTSAGFSVSAYKNPTTGQLVIIAINRDSWATRVKFQPGFPVTATPYVTSSVQNLEPQPDVSLGDLVTIPGKRVVTFVCVITGCRDWNQLMAGSGGSRASSMAARRRECGDSVGGGGVQVAADGTTGRASRANASSRRPPDGAWRLRSALADIIRPVHGEVAGEQEDLFLVVPQPGREAVAGVVAGVPVPEPVVDDPGPDGGVVAFRRSSRTC